MWHPPPPSTHIQLSILHKADFAFVRSRQLPNENNGTLMKSTFRCIQNLRRYAAAFMLVCFAPVSVRALPTAPQVVNGTAAISTSGNTMTITNSANAIINWQGFSIGNNETTRFIQPSAASAVLNRITGGDPSAILGALQSNGKVLLCAIRFFWTVNPVLTGQ